MATPHGRHGNWLLKALGAMLAAGAMALAGPAALAVADPLYGPDPNNFKEPAVTEYVNAVNGLVEQLNGDSPAGPISQQQFTDELTAANNRLQEALLANADQLARSAPDD